MKKIMSLMLGLALVLGTTAFAADEKPADKGASAEKKSKKKSSKKMDKSSKTDATTK